MSVVITDRGQTTSYIPLSWFPSTYNLETSPPSLTIKLLSPLHKHIEASTGCVWYFKQTNMTSNSALNLKSRAFCGTAECKFSNSTTEKNGSKNTTIYHLAYGIWINQENQQDSCVGNQSAVVSVLPNNIISPLLKLKAILESTLVRENWSENNNCSLQCKQIR